MAQPSSSHHGDRHRSERSSHHHHRTISSTTLLLVLSLVLAVLAVMLSLPSQSTNPNTSEPNSAGLLGFLTPKRSHALIARESSVAMREADVARREAELLAGAPGGVVPSQSPIICPVSTTVETVYAPAQTIIKEVPKEESLTPPGWVGNRAEEILDRELKITERERDISKREENVNRREHDASLRENWIMEQLIALGSDNAHTVEEEVVYEPSGSKRKLKALPPLIISETAFETQTQTVTQTQTITLPSPASTRLAAPPEVVSSLSTSSSPKTTAVDIITEEDTDGDGRKTVTVVRSPRLRPPSRWFPPRW